MFSLLPSFSQTAVLFRRAGGCLALVTARLAAASILLTALVHGPLVHSSVDANYAVDNPLGLLPGCGSVARNATLLAIVAASMAGIVSLWCACGAHEATCASS